MEITDLLVVSQKNNASDLHLSIGNPPLLRVNGDMLPLKMNRLEADDVRQMLYSIMTEQQRTEYERDMEIDFALTFSEHMRFRVNAFNTLAGPAAVLRTIPTKILTLEDLHTPEVLKRLTDLHKGLILVTGPTGSGKSTTLAAMVNHINENYSKHILTIEDPVEFVHKSKKSLVNQREVGASTKSFARALKSALREDPDVILVGELRDLETIQLAMSAAETGHLVMGTLHTVSAPKTIDRIIDVFPANDKEMVRSMLSVSIEAIIAQALVKRADGTGRVAVHEILLGTPAVRNLIRENKIPQIASMMQVGSRVGMKTMKDAAYELLNDNIIAQDTVKTLLATGSSGENEGEAGGSDTPGMKRMNAGGGSGGSGKFGSGGFLSMAQEYIPRPRLDPLFARMAELKGSDMYLTVGFTPSIRVEERIVPVGDVPLKDEDIDAMIAEMLDEDKRDEFYSTMEFNMPIHWRDGRRFRINMFRQQQHSGAVIRRIETDIPTSESLTLPKIYNDLIMENRGLVLVVGSTGSGKTTSLAAMAGHRNRHGYGHILTIEDPIEYIHAHQGCIITQRDVGVDTYSFGMALKNALRQRPDVVIIGEIRDRETMEHALHFSETGHLCVATLHAGNSIQAIERVLNFFPEEKQHQVLYSLGNNLRAILSQRLILTLHNKRRVAVEVMLNRGFIRTLIQERKLKELPEIIAKNRGEGMQSFDQALYQLYLDKIISEETAISESDNPANIRLLIRQQQNVKRPVLNNEPMTPGFQTKTTGF